MIVVPIGFDIHMGVGLERNRLISHPNHHSHNVFYATLVPEFRKRSESGSPQMDVAEARINAFRLRAPSARIVAFAMSRC
jgi:hypothetical protein